MALPFLPTTYSGSVIWDKFALPAIYPSFAGRQEQLRYGFHILNRGMTSFRNLQSHRFALVQRAWV
jgi:hypothetical protein